MDQVVDPVSGSHGQESEVNVFEVSKVGECQSRLLIVQDHCGHRSSYRLRWCFSPPHSKRKTSGTTSGLRV